MELRIYVDWRATKNDSSCDQCKISMVPPHGSIWFLSRRAGEGRDAKAKGGRRHCCGLERGRGRRGKVLFASYIIALTGSIIIYVKGTFGWFDIALMQDL